MTRENISVVKEQHFQTYQTGQCYLESRVFVIESDFQTYWQNKLFLPSEWKQICLLQLSGKRERDITVTRDRSVILGKMKNRKKQNGWQNSSLFGSHIDLSALF